MKTLLTTDFTEASGHAIEYAVQLLSKYEVDKKYYLLHAYKPMAPYAEVGSIPVFQNAAWKDESEEKLKEINQQLKKKYKLDATPIVKRGGVYEVVRRLEKNEEEKPDLVVMATQEKSLFQRLTFGSNTLHVAENSDTPVLIVPTKAEIAKPKTVAFATDLKPLKVPYDSLKLAKDIIKTYESDLHVVHVFESEDEKEKSESLKDSAIHRYLEEIDHKHIAMVNESVYEGIVDYMEKYQPDMLVIIPRDRNFFKNLFHESITTKMTYHSEIPLLVLN